MTLKLFLSFATCFIMYSSVVTAQTKKQMREEYKQKQEEIKHEKKLEDEALNGNAASAYELGMDYFVGRVSYPNYDSAIKYLIIAQQAGYPEAMYQFGVMCQYGVPYWKGSNVEKPNRNEAKAWYKHAADRGYNLAIDKLKQYEIADNNPVQLADSLIAKSNYDEGFRILKIAAECNYDALAMYKISQLYFYGNLVGYDEYSHWLAQSADHGYGPACLESALYFEEQAQKFNSKGYADLATEYFIKAAGYGYKVAQEKRDAYFKKEEQAKAEREKYIANNPSSTNNTAASKPTATETRKTCPICNGTGKITDRYTTEKRDWGNKTITMTDYVTKKACSRCNGKGYYTY